MGKYARLRRLLEKDIELALGPATLGVGPIRDYH